MGQLLNLGFKNVCNNGNLGNTPNLTPAEIYDLILKSQLFQYELLYSTYAGTFTGMFYNGGLNGQKIIKGGAGEMIDAAFLNAIPDNSIIKINIQTRSLSGSASVGSSFLQKTIGGTDYQDLYTWQVSSIQGTWTNITLIITANELKQIDTLLYSQAAGTAPAMYIKINIYNVTNI